MTNWGACMTSCICRCTRDACCVMALRHWQTLVCPAAMCWCCSSPPSCRLHRSLLPHRCGYAQCWGGTGFRLGHLMQHPCIEHAAACTRLVLPLETVPAHKRNWLNPAQDAASPPMTLSSNSTTPSTQHPSSPHRAHAACGARSPPATLQQRPKPPDVLTPLSQHAKTPNPTPTVMF